MGVCIAFSVHHAFDLFPTEWTGYALISIPFYGWTPWLFHGYGLRLARTPACTLPLDWCKGGWMRCGICWDLSIFSHGPRQKNMLGSVLPLPS